MNSPSHSDNLRQILRQAKDQFESGRRQIENQNIQAAITGFDAMLFECARARRIVRDAPETVDLGVDRDEFLAVMDDVAKNRNVQEHWQDPKNPRQPKSHERTTPAGLKIAVDETSLIILGPEEVYKGKLNLYDVYRFVVQKLSIMEAKHQR